MKVSTLSQELHSAGKNMSHAAIGVWTYRCCWLAIFWIHGLVVCYCCMMAWLYAFLPDTYLDQTFQYIQLGLGTKNYPAIGNTHLIATLPHAFAITTMVLGSAWRCRLRYSLDYHPWASTKVSSSSRMKSLLSLRAAQYAARVGNFLHFHLVSPQGIFGVQHKHFDDILLVREVFETGFQTYQGYRMSWYLPRTRLNNFFVLLLVLNCWSTALVQLVYQGGPGKDAKRRLVCLVCDSLLDLVCSVGIPTIVFLSYWRLYDPEIGGFADDLWYDDPFLVQVVSELKMVIVSSWMDLVSCVAFLLGVYSSIENIKELIHSILSSKVRDQLSIVPPHNGVRIDVATVAPVTTHRSTGKTTKSTRRLHGVVFGVWGLVVLVLHLHASSLAIAPHCLLQVRPWGITHPACSLVQTNCHEIDIVGSAVELQEAWSAVEPSVVLRLVVRHCPALELPAHIQRFSHLSGLKIYNSTIVQWDTNAELNAVSHPDLMFLNIVRVNVSNGDLPLGLQAPVFPPKLFDWEFCITNIARLPANLDKSWHEASTIYVERSQLDEFPDVLVRLKPKHISVGDNPIKTLPPGAFESPNLVYISIGGTLINEVADNVTSISDAIIGIMAPNTNISYWYSWIDTLSGRSDYYSVYAYNTPYCNELNEIRAGNRTAFSTTTSPSARAKLSHALIEDLALADWYAYCGTWPSNMFPWENEDARYALPQ